MIEVYVDGSFKDGVYSGAYVAYERYDRTIIYQDCGIGTDIPELVAMGNVAGEMMATMRAVKWLNAYAENTYSIILYDFLGLEKWITGEWKARDNKWITKYIDYVKPYYKKYLFGFMHVKAHTNVQGNEYADKLAKLAIQFNKTWIF